MRESVRSQPDWSERWKWSQTRPVSASLRQKSSVTTVGSSEPSLSLSSGAAFAMAHTASARPGVSGRSYP